MSFRAEQCSKLYNGQIVSREGFTQNTTASVATACVSLLGVSPAVAENPGTIDPVDVQGFGEGPGSLPSG